MYGGAAGGGKSDALLFAFLQYADVPYYRGLILRRKLVDLTRGGAILDRALKWWQPYSRTGITYEAGKRRFIFPSGATCEFGHAQHAGDEEQNYQGGSWHFIAFDEGTQFESSQYLYLFSRLRRDDELTRTHNAGVPLVPLRMRVATNPGGPSHNFFRDRFMTRDFAESFLRGENKPAFFRELRDESETFRRWFVPARVTDNAAIDSREYSASLRNLDVVRRERLLAGNWLVNESGVFLPDWFRRYERIESGYRLLDASGLTTRIVHDYECQRIVTVDIAGTSRDRDAALRRGEPCSTAVSVFDVTNDGLIIWHRVIRMQGEFPAVLAAIRGCYAELRPTGIWIEVDGIGRPYYQQLASEGMPVYALTSEGKDKLTRATPATNEAAEGRIYLPTFAPWLDALESELWAWQGSSSEQTDQIDTLAYACLLKVRGQLGGVIVLQ